MTRTVGAVLCGIWLAACVGCSRSVDFERMRQQQRLDPYEASTAFADGMSMRMPPAATVPRGSDVRSAFAAGVEAGVPVRVVPVPITSDLVERGRLAFGAFCAVCHGRGGRGDAVMASNMPGRPPPSLVTGDAAELPAGRLFAVISRGMDRMPAYDWALPADERWAVVAYVEDLRQRTSRTDGTAR